VVKGYPDLPPACGPRHELEQVLRNLLVHAWHTMSGGDIITPTPQRQGATTQLGSLSLRERAG